MALSLELREIPDHLHGALCGAFDDISELESQKTMANSRVLSFSFLRNKCRFGGSVHQQHREQQVQKEKFTKHKL